MATPNEKFVASLKILKNLQDSGEVGIYKDDIPNTMYRDILIKNGFIKQVIRGWYIAITPEKKEGDSTSSEN